MYSVLCCRPSAMVQVMLQLPGTDYQLPVNIPAETILPALTKYLPKLPPATVAVTTADSSTVITKLAAAKTEAGLVLMSLTRLHQPFDAHCCHMGCLLYTSPSPRDS